MAGMKIYGIYSSSSAGSGNWLTSDFQGTYEQLLSFIFSQRWGRVLINSSLGQFHADKLSSAHIYLRLVEGQSWEDVPQELLIDCCQLTKANSIEGT